MKKRTVVLVFLTALGAITFLDRLCIAVAGPRMQDELGISPEQWGWILGAFVAEAEGAILGTYYLRRNQAGGGSHVCNCGYMVEESLRGRGTGRSLCRHSQEEAVKLGFRAMQFNLVVSTNEPAVNLWLKEGFTEVGRLPEAFNHRDLGFVDAIVMYKMLKDAPKK